MFLTPRQRSLIERVLNVAETGKPEGKYGAVTRLKDGPHKIRQITYGRSQTTEYGNLRELIMMYVNAGGAQSAKLKPHVDRIGGDETLVDDQKFIDLLKAAGADPVMHRVQDEFFTKRYFDPAMRWADANSFILPLSALIIYDSFIHSGQVLWFLRTRFPESTPSAGGDERKWIKAYTKARHDWLTNHTDPILPKTNYRTTCYLEQIAAGNWNLDAVPILMNGTNVSPAQP